MACTNQFGLQKVLPDPTDTEALRQTMQAVNKLVDLVSQLIGNGRPFFDSDGDGEYVRDSADNTIIRQTFKSPAVHWPHTHRAGAVIYGLDGVFWENSNFSAVGGVDGYGYTHIEQGHSHALGLTVREAWDFREPSLKGEGAS